MNQQVFSLTCDKMVCILVLCDGFQFLCCVKDVSGMGNIVVGLPEQCDKCTKCHGGTVYLFNNGVEDWNQTVEVDLGN